MAQLDHHLLIVVVALVIVIVLKDNHISQSTTPFQKEIVLLRSQ